MSTVIAGLGSFGAENAPAVFSSSYFAHEVSFVCLCRDGASILDTVHEAGYFDQAHLTRSLRVLIGVTPAGITRHDAQLSFLYKTCRPAPG